MFVLAEMAGALQIMRKYLGASSLYEIFPNNFLVKAVIIIAYFINQSNMLDSWWNFIFKKGNVPHTRAPTV